MKTKLGKHTCRYYDAILYHRRRRAAGAPELGGEGRFNASIGTNLTTVGDAEDSDS